jgi:hypothetical protein
MRWWIGMLLSTALLATAGHAQLPRQFPPNGKLGELHGEPRQPFPLLQISGNTLRLAPGGRIFDEHNRIILHGTIPERAYVLFVEDRNGQVSHVYLLRPDELERIMKSR